MIRRLPRPAQDTERSPRGARGLAQHLLEEVVLEVMAAGARDQHAALLERRHRRAVELAIRARASGDRRTRLDQRRRIGDDQTEPLSRALELAHDVEAIALAEADPVLEAISLGV